MAAVHIIGAGLAGLSCAVRLAKAGRRVTLHEAAPQAGGRCRSFYDRQIDRVIDNGNHLLLSGNREALAFLRISGAEDGLSGPTQAAFPFFDLRSGQRYVIRPNDGPIPWWTLARGRRIPGARLPSYLSALRLLSGPAHATVAERISRDHPLYRPFWEPLTLAALNAVPEMAAASLLKAVLRDSFARGGRACRPLLARDSLSATFVAPAVRWLRSMGAELLFNRRLRRLAFQGGMVNALVFADGAVRLDEDQVVLAVPPAACRRLLPDLFVPRGDSAILNAYFAIEDERLRGGPPSFVGLLNGRAHWAFLRDGLISATVSAAPPIGEGDEALVHALWRDVSRPFGLDGRPLPPFRLLREKRATFLQTPENNRRRPGQRSPLRNLFLAGDWTDTGLPATIEGAVLSGRRAAEAILG